MRRSSFFLTLFCSIALSGCTDQDRDRDADAEAARAPIPYPNVCSEIGRITPPHNAVKWKDWDNPSEILVCTNTVGLSKFTAQWTVGNVASSRTLAKNQCALVESAIELRIKVASKYSNHAAWFFCADLTPMQLVRYDEWRVDNVEDAAEVEQSDD